MQFFKVISQTKYRVCLSVCLSVYMRKYARTLLFLFNPTRVQLQVKDPSAEANFQIILFICLFYMPFI